MTKMYTYLCQKRVQKSKEKGFFREKPSGIRGSKKNGNKLLIYNHFGVHKPGHQSDLVIQKYTVLYVSNLFLSFLLSLKACSH